MEYLASLPNSEEFKTGRPGIAIHAYLMAADRNHDRVQSREAQLRKDAEDGKLSEEVRRRATELLDMTRHINGGMRMGISLTPVAAKIDLAAMAKD